MLGQLKSEIVISRLLNALEDEDREVRCSAAKALGKIQSEATIPGLLKALEDEDSQVRKSVAAVLGKIQSEAVVPGLLKALEDKDSQVRKSVAIALGKIQSEASIPGLLKALKDENWFVRWSTAATLGQIQSEAAILPIWQQHQKNPQAAFKQVIQAIQNRCKIYNAEISQLVLSEDQPPASTTAQTINVDLQGAIIGNLANTVGGHQQTFQPLLPNAAKTSETRE